jgi:hypothetical protein
MSDWCISIEVSLGGFAIGTIPSSIGNLHLLSILALDGNSLTGTMTFHDTAMCNGNADVH